MIIRFAVAALLLLAFAAPAHAAPRWCASYKSTEQVFPGQAKSEIENFRKSRTHTRLIEAARYTCGLPDDAAAAEILQLWMTETGLAQPEAIASLAARIDPTWADQQEALCNDAIPWKDQAQELAAMHSSRSAIFGCANAGRDDPAWMGRGPQINELAPFLDGGAMERDRDEIVRLGWVVGEVSHMLDPKEHEAVLANYAIAQYDIKALDYNAAWAQLDAAPYRGSVYARMVLRETIAHTKAAIAQLDAMVAKRTEDATWKDVIITLPQKASAAWLAAAAAHKDMLAHSDTARGCEATLRADAIALIKPLVRGESNLAVLVGKLGEDPLAGLIVRRLATCVQANGDEATSRVVSDLAAQVRQIRGPRSAAFVATSNAVAGLRHPPFTWRDLSDPDPRVESYPGSNISTDEAVIASSASGPEGARKLTFVKSRYQARQVSCKETNKVDRIMPDGKLVYRQVCVDAGTVWRDSTPSPITVVASCTAGLAKGRVVDVNTTVKVAKAVYADKSRKRLVAAYCLSLE